jgi:hypothetical protein
MLAGRGRLSFQLVRETWVGCAVVFRLAFFAAFAACESALFAVQAVL